MFRVNENGAIYTGTSAHAHTRARTHTHTHTHTHNGAHPCVGRTKVHESGGLPQTPPTAHPCIGRT